MFICSDIHGRYDRYLKVLDIVGDDPLYIIGDVIDRGPGGMDILVDTMKRDNITLLIGNHEWMMYNALFGSGDYFDVWMLMNNGGHVTYDSYKAGIRDGRYKESEIKEYLRSLPLAIDFGDIYLVHGMPPFNTDSEGEYPRIIYHKNTPYDEVDTSVWQSPFKSPYMADYFEKWERDRSTLVYSGHVINVYAYGKKNKDKLSYMDMQDGRIHVLDIDGGCAVPDGSRDYAGRVIDNSLILINTDAKKPIKIK